MTRRRPRLKKHDESRRAFLIGGAGGTNCDGTKLAVLTRSSPNFWAALAAIIFCSLVVLNAPLCRT
jgi:hypothetical protein